MVVTVAMWCRYQMLTWSDGKGVLPAIVEALVYDISTPCILDQAFWYNNMLSSASLL